MDKVQQMKLIGRARPITKEISVQLNKKMIAKVEGDRLLFFDASDEDFILGYNSYKGHFYEINHPRNIHKLDVDMSVLLNQKPPEPEKVDINKLQRRVKAIETKLSQDENIAKGVPVKYRTMKYDPQKDNFYDVTSDEFRVAINDKNQAQYVKPKRFDKRFATKESAVYYCFITQRRTITDNVSEVNVAKLKDRFVPRAKAIVNKSNEVLNKYNKDFFARTINEFEKSEVKQMLADYNDIIHEITIELKRFSKDKDKTSSEPIQQSPEEIAVSKQEIEQNISEIKAETSDIEHIIKNANTWQDIIDSEDDFDAQAGYGFEEAFKSKVKGVFLKG